MTLSTLTTNAPVTDVSAAAYTIPTDSPEADGTISWEATTLIVVAARCAEVTGTGWSYGHQAAATVVNDLLSPIVVGRDAFDITGAFSGMVNAVRNVGRGGVAGQALSAVDVALWDLKARLLDVPLHRLIGAARDAVPVYGSGGFTTYDHEQLREQLVTWTKELNIPRVKIKVGESWGSQANRDIPRMRQARTIVGDETELYVDANGGYDRKQAVRIFGAVADLDIRWFEEPVSSDDLTGLRSVREMVTADVTAGEYGYDLSYFTRMVSADAVDCLQADATRCGGITEWLRVAAVAAGHNLDLSGHCAPYLHAAVAAAVPNLRHLEWFHDHARIEVRYFDGAALPVDGLLRLDPTAPGNGLTPRAADLDPFRVR